MIIFYYCLYITLKTITQIARDSKFSENPNSRTVKDSARFQGTINKDFIDKYILSKGEKIYFYFSGSKKMAAASMVTFSKLLF